MKLMKQLNMVVELKSKLEQQNEELASFLPREVRRIREDLNMSQEKFAKKLGVTQVYISRIELGISMPSSELLYKIAEMEK